jgi:hypothetical protein
MGSRIASLEVVEQVFLLFPVGVAPLAVKVVSRLLFPDGPVTSRPLRAASLLLPAAAGAAALSFLFPRGSAAAGWLAVPWVVFAAGLLVALASQLGRMRALGLSRLSLAGAAVFLAVGSVWLLLSRLGATPPRFTAPVVFLAALHFHFTGLAGCTLVAATEPWVRRLLPGLRRAYGLVIGGSVAGIPLIAAGNVLSLRLLKLGGVAIVSLTVIALAGFFLLLAPRLDDAVARLLLGVAGVSALGGMTLALVYGAGEFMGTTWVTLEQMARWHAPVNAVGFTLTGLLAHALRRRARPAVAA